jgi:hypothetical protein
MDRIFMLDGLAQPAGTRKLDDYRTCLEVLRDLNKTGKAPPRSPSRKALPTANQWDYKIRDLPQMILKHQRSTSIFWKPRSDSVR